MQPDCLGQRFGHDFIAGICQKCRGFQNPLKGMEKIELPQKKNKSGSARAFLISQFLEEINKDRDGVRFKKLTPQILGVKLAHIKTMEDLRWFYDDCWQEDRLTKKKIWNSKKFWWKLKNK